LVAMARTYTLADLRREFPDDAACLDCIWRLRYSPDGETADCPKCGRRRRFHRLSRQRAYSCDTCGWHIHPTAGTIFHKSSTGLQLWFVAIFLIASARGDISVKRLERELGVTYKTAWRMSQRIHSML
jgi:transposase